MYQVLCVSVVDSMCDVSSVCVQCCHHVMYQVLCVCSVVVTM